MSETVIPDLPALIAEAAKGKTITYGYSQRGKMKIIKTIREDDNSVLFIGEQRFVLFVISRRCFYLLEREDDKVEFSDVLINVCFDNVPWEKFFMKAVRK